MFWCTLQAPIPARARSCKGELRNFSTASEMDGWPPTSEFDAGDVSIGLVVDWVKRSQAKNKKTRAIMYIMVIELVCVKHERGRWS